MDLFKKTRLKHLGADAERTAEQYLKRQGLTLIKRNFHSRFGEIDLIMRNADTWLFIEVRCRAENAQVSASESISPQKMRKIRKTAEYFMCQFNEVPACRFDVVAMSHSEKKIGYTIDWIKNAF